MNVRNPSRPVALQLSRHAEKVVSNKGHAQQPIVYRINPGTAKASAVSLPTGQLRGKESLVCPYPRHQTSVPFALGDCSRFGYAAWLQLPWIAPTVKANVSVATVHGRDIPQRAN